MSMITSKHRMIEKGRSRAVFTTSGNLFEFISSDIMVNLFRATEKENPSGNIWIRLYQDEGIRVYPLTGNESKSEMIVREDGVTFRGVAGSVGYTVRFILSEECFWFWQVNLSGNGETADIVYGQDLGMASPGGVLTNELYVAQYLGRSVFENEAGYHICSRQNMDQGGRNPFIQQGLLKGKSVAYATDGLQFFGLEYKRTQQPAGLSGNLPSVLLQHEFAYTALQTEKMKLDRDQEIIFYNAFVSDCPHSGNRISLEDIWRHYHPAEETANAERLLSSEIAAQFGEPYASPLWEKPEIEARFPERRLEERDQGNILSFFLQNHAHIVTQQKELLTERPHGTIISTFVDTEKVNPNLLSTTHYMYGVFNSQTVVGNTSMHKLISTARGSYNNMKYTGQRLYVKYEGQYRLLTLPAVYETGMNYSKWYYTMGEDTLVVTSYIPADQTDAVLEVTSEKGRRYDFIVTAQIAMGDHEFINPFTKEMKADGKILRIKPHPDTGMKEYPGLSYDIQLPGTEFAAGADEIFFADGETRDESLLTWQVSGDQFQMIISGHLNDAQAKVLPLYFFETHREKAEKNFAELTRGLKLEIDGQPQIEQEVEILTETIWWYSHNAMIHYAVPHGMEQPGGAAWGTRDICQGPMEYFFAMHRFDLAKAVLKEIFTHQQEKSGEWPQWFMFDRYTANAGECHGDVVFWPLKITAEYLMLTEDYACLQEQIPYCDETGAQKAASVSLLAHLKRAIQAVEERFVGDTHLISYAGGDWDDTLQPAKEELRQSLISTWTQALGYQSIHELSESLAPVQPDFAKELSGMANQIKEDFNRLLIRDGVITGFVRHNEDGSFTPMLHPADNATGIHYRLLPMTRSIIAEMVDAKQARNNMQIIDDNLLCPDGARLMDNPPRYHGGVSELFVRAEQAAYVGREVGLMYSHAHVRYIEALAKIGDAENTWKQLFTINPILIREHVPGAAMRQSNLYFSSSEGAFHDRYEFSENFDKLRTGDITVKGGWRLYSSGTGIYLNQLISNILGLSVRADSIMIHPCLPKPLEGLRVQFECFGKLRTFVYRAAGQLGVTVDGKTLGNVQSASIYGGQTVCLTAEDFESIENDIVIDFVCC